MARTNAYQLDPGPFDSSVLTGKLIHISWEIWKGSDNMILNTRRCDGKFWNLVKKYPIPPQVLEVIQLSKLYNVYRFYQPKVNCSLITSLVERWYPETYTFHLGGIMQLLFCKIYRCCMAYLWIVILYLIMSRWGL